MFSSGYGRRSHAQATSHLLGGSALITARDIGAFTTDSRVVQDLPVLFIRHVLFKALG